MFAVIETGGKQYLVKTGDSLKIEKIDGDAGEEVVFDRVLLEGNEDGTDVKIGKPFLEGAAVTAVVEEQGRSKKIRVLRFKRKVRHKKVFGHRQDFTQVTIKDIK